MNTANGSSNREKDRRFAQLKKALAKLGKMQEQLAQTQQWKPASKEGKTAKTKELKRLKNQVSTFEADMQEKFKDLLKEKIDEDHDE